MPILVALAFVPPRFVYVDAQNRVRLSDDPKVRSLRPSARQPDLSPDGRRFVYWAERDAAMVEHDLATGAERVLHRGNLRSPRYAADGRTILFTENPKDRWSLYALDRATGRVRMLLRASATGIGFVSQGERVGDLFDPAPQADGTVVVQDMSRALWIAPEGNVRKGIALASVAPQDGVTSESVLLPAPGKPYRLIGAFDVPDPKGNLSGTDGRAGALYLVDAKTLKGRRLTPASFTAMRPCWARDGATVLFVGGRAKGPYGIWSVRPDGTGLSFFVRGDEPSAGPPNAR